MAMKLAGAAYLVWLGLSLLRDRDNAVRPDLTPLSAQRRFAQSIVVEVLNPKTRDLLPRLPAAIRRCVGEHADVGPAARARHLVQSDVLAVDVVCVIFASAVMAKLQRSRRSQRIMQRVGGSIWSARRTARVQDR